MANTSKVSVRGSFAKSALHIVHGVLSLDVGGLERLVVNMISESVATGHRVTILCLERTGSLANEAVSLGAQVLCLDKPQLSGVLLRKRCLEVFRLLSPDIVHSHQIGVAWHIGSVCRRLSIPLIHTEHGNHFIGEASFFKIIKKRILMFLAGKNISEFCCVSDEIATAVARWNTINKRKISVVSNGIATDSFSSIEQKDHVRRQTEFSSSAFIIGTVGRLAEVKNQDLLIRAFYIVRRVRSDIRLLIVGDGPEKTKLQKIVVDLGLEQDVCFAGYQSRPELYLQIMDIFALTSRSEGLPVSILEAWRESLPVVSSAVGGVPAIIENGVNGILLQSLNADELANIFLTVLADKNLASTLGANGRDSLLKKYSLGKMLDEYVGRYEALACLRK